MLGRSLLVEILKRDAEKNHPTRHPREIAEAFMVTARDPNVSMMHRNGSILVLNNKPTGTEFHFINSVNMKLFIENVNFLLKEAEKAGFKEIKTTFTNPKILEVAKAQPYPIDCTKDGDTYTMKVRLKWGG